MQIKFNRNDNTIPLFAHPLHHSCQNKGSLFDGDRWAASNDHGFKIVAALISMYDKGNLFDKVSYDEVDFFYPNGDCMCFSIIQLQWARKLHTEIAFFVGPLLCIATTIF